MHSARLTSLRVLAAALWLAPLAAALFAQPSYAPWPRKAAPPIAIP